MATFYGKGELGSAQDTTNRQIQQKVGELTANPGKRDIPGNLVPDLYAGKMSLEDFTSAVGGSPDFNPSIGPKIDYGQGKQNISPAQLGSLAQGKSIQDAAQIGAPINQQQQQYNQQAQQFNQSQYAKLAGQLKGTPPPNVNQGIGAVTSAMQTTNPPQNPNVQNFLQSDQTIQTANKELMNFNHPTNLQTELMNQMQTIIGKQGQLGSLKAEYMNIQNIMGGTEDDLRNEVEKAGGFATDSQVQALAIARNKTLMKKAALLQNQMQLQQDAIQNSQQLLNFEKDMAATQFNQQMEMAKLSYQMQKDTKTAALDSLNTIVKTAGYSALLGSPEQNARVEQLYGLPKGGLLQLVAIDEKKRAQADLKTQLDLQNQQLQNQKLLGDIQEQKAKTSQEVNALKSAASQNQIENISSLINDEYLSTAVGTVPIFGDISWSNWATGGKSNFIAGIEQIRSQLTLDNLINAKAQGATFGALNQTELQTLAASATKLGTWAKKDSDGNVVGYKANESDFKNELAKINNMAKLDYVLKGGDPQLVGLQSTPDGHLWTTNWDGSLTQVK